MENITTQKVPSLITGRQYIDSTKFKTSLPSSTQNAAKLSQSKTHLSTLKPNKMHSYSQLLSITPESTFPSPRLPWLASRSCLCSIIFEFKHADSVGAVPRVTEQMACDLLTPRGSFHGSIIPKPNKIMPVSLIKGLKLSRLTQETYTAPLLSE